MPTWLDQEREALRAQDTWPIIQITTSMDPRREGNRPYRLDTIDDHATRPRQRFFDTYADLVAAVKRSNPGTVIREA